MNIDGSIALVTGANRGLGRAFAAHLLERGATKVYAAARRPEAVDLPGVEPVRLDITDPARVAELAGELGDVTLLINNAGTSAGVRLLDAGSDGLRDALGTHLFGSLDTARAFAPVLARNGGGAIVNVLSALSWLALPSATTYHVAKAAEWGLTNGLRLELLDQGTLVTGLHLGAADTDMTGDYDGPKLDPADVARAALDGVEAGAWEVLADDWSAQVKAALAGDPRDFHAAIAGMF
ncbi:SDR family oxidoreductase [Patulibacter sp. SYSU D01012]|uniref:SDR family oxidoreductase n=1 Tax=Patulibacter sp. SYSU D01012 TaxID=2817381 RepID=UPI001B30EA57|nr:SDR family oxidoreductase [Patulibacter sp. SYSU D01012]